MLLSCVLSHDRTDARDIATDLADLAGVGKLLSGTLHAQVVSCLQQALELLDKDGSILGMTFAVFLRVSLSYDVAVHKGRGDGQLSGGQAESLPCKLFAYTVHFIKQLAGL